MLRAINLLAPMMFMLTLSNLAIAQSEFDSRNLLLPTPGEPRSFPGDVAPKVENLGTDIGSTIAAGSAFLREYKSNVHATRNTRDIAVYRDAAPAVVLVVVKDGFGSGSLLEDHTILTNWHVVEGYHQVNVIFKPADPFRAPSKDDMVAAQVIKTDPVHDLALLRPKALPARAIKPIGVATQDNIEVGADVHAIGHPTGEMWTYTTGIVSQIRPDNEWSGGEKDVKHRATVIQTQTAINPGNSGGPLLEDGGLLVGVNAFAVTSAQALNFAISARDARAFLAAPLTQGEVEDECRSRVLFEGRSKKDDGFIKTERTRDEEGS
jgi:S1-C subfamily serine protease